MDYSLHHIVRQPKTPTAHPNLLLMLHGYGSHEEDLFSLAPALPDDLFMLNPVVRLILTILSWGLIITGIVTLFS